MESKAAIDALTALAHAGRLSVFRLLVRRAPDLVPAGEIAEVLGVRPSTLSNQLAELEAAGLVVQQRDGRSIRYGAHVDAMGALIGYLAADCCRGRPEACLPAAQAHRARLGAPPYNVLFLCTANSARSIFGEAVLSRLGEGRFRAFSCGAHPRGEIHPMAERVLEAHGFDPRLFRSKGPEEFTGASAPALDIVISVCDRAANEPCPTWHGSPFASHWGVPDPVPTDGAASFERAFDLMAERVALLVELPLPELDPLSLQREIDRIGTIGTKRMERMEHAI